MVGTRATVRRSSRCGRRQRRRESTVRRTRIEEEGSFSGLVPRADGEEEQRVAIVREVDGIV
jgi:hypothetical protein